MPSKRKFLIRLFIMFFGLFVFGSQGTKAQIFIVRTTPKKVFVEPNRISLRLHGISSDLEGLIVDSRADLQLNPIRANLIDGSRLFVDLSLGSASLGAVLAPVLGIRPSMFLRLNPAGISSASTNTQGTDSVSLSQIGSGGGQMNLIFGGGEFHFAVGYGYSIEGIYNKSDSSSMQVTNQTEPNPANSFERSFARENVRNNSDRSWDENHSIRATVLFGRKTGRSFQLGGLWRVRFIENIRNTRDVEIDDYDPDGDGLAYREYTKDGEIIMKKTSSTFVTKPYRSFSLIRSRISEAELNFLLASDPDEDKRWRILGRILHVVEGKGHDTYVDETRIISETILGNTFVDTIEEKQAFTVKPSWAEWEVGLGLEFDGKKQLIVVALRYKGILDKKDMDIGIKQTTLEETKNGSLVFSSKEVSGKQDSLRERSSTHHLVLPLGLEYYANDRLILRGGVQGNISGVWVQDLNGKWLGTANVSTAVRLGMGYQFSRAFLIDMYVNSSLTTLSSYALSGSLSF